MKVKRTLLSVLACVLSLMLVFAFAACGDSKKTTVTLSDSEITLAIGDTKRVTATVSDDSEVTWTSANETIATVSNVGLVKGMKEGETTITATANGVSATCTVKVENYTVELDKTTLTLDHKDSNNKSATLTATVKKNGTAIEESVRWTSDNEKVATVVDGVVTAVGEGEANIIASRTTGNVSATCKVTVAWASKPESYKAIANYEQNKVPANTWGYWNDMNYEGASTTMYEAYYEDYAADNGEGNYIGAGKATFDFAFDSVTTTKAIAIQVVYRSAGEEGKLETNHDYKLTLKLESSVAGTVILNPHFKDEDEEFDDAADIAAKTFEIESGVNTIELTFRHGDYGYLFPAGNYTNVESALFAQLGLLSEEVELGQRISVSFYDLQWEDLGASEVAKDLPDFVKEDNIEYEEGETFEADYSTLLEEPTGTDGVIGEDEWAIWWVADASWGCGEEVSMEKSIDATNKSLTTTFAGGDQNWSVQLRYINSNVEKGEMYKLSLTINSDTAYAITVNGKNYDLEVGDNEIEVKMSAGDYSLECMLANSDSDDSITLIFKDVTWTELIAPEVEYEEGETFEADYTTLAESAKGTADGIVANEWAFWWVMDASWNCGEVVNNFEKSIDATNKSITTTFAAGDNDWSVQLHYINPDVVKKNVYKLTLTITSDTAYTVSLNGKYVKLVEGENEVEVIFTAGDYAFEMSMANPANDDAITLTLADIQWTELTVVE